MRMRGSGFDGNSFMSNTGMGESNAGQGAIGGLNNMPTRISNDGAARGGYGGFIQKSNSICGDMMTSGTKRPGTASNLDFNRGSLHNADEQESQNPGLIDDNSEKTAGMGGSSKHGRPRTSQPNNKAYSRASTSYKRGADTG